MKLCIVEIGATNLASNGILTAQCKGVSDEDDYSDCPIFGQLGITARAYQSDDNGRAEAIIDENTGTIIASRDTRVAAVVGNIVPGDTCLHSTGPVQSARIFCKEEKKLIALLVKDKNDKDMGIIIDGQNQKIMLMISGVVMCEWSVDRIISSFTKDGFSNSIEQTASAGGDSVKIQGGQVSIGAGPVYLQGAVGPAGPVNQVSPSVSLSTT
jgi:hypothetical protein